MENAIWCENTQNTATQHVVAREACYSETKKTVRIDFVLVFNVGYNDIEKLRELKGD